MQRTEIEPHQASVCAGDPPARRSLARVRRRAAAVLNVRQSREADLIGAVLAGDRRAQELFLTRYRRLIYHILHQAGVQDGVMDDMYQSVILALWDRDCRRLARWTGRGPFTAYLCTVVRRIACDELRRSASPLPTERIDDSAEASRLTCRGPEEILEQRYYASAISRVISKLRPSDARLIMYRHIENLSYGQIGSELGMTVSHVGVALHRSVRRMRDLLESELA